MHVTFSRPHLDDPALAAEWQAHARAWDAPVFRHWAWVGCLAQVRYPDPLLARVQDGGALVGLALFNRRRGRLGAALHLHESGDAAMDGVFIEHNGVLAPAGLGGPVLAAVLRAARGHAGRVMLSGIDDAGLAAARACGVVGPLQTRAAPFAALTPGRDVLEGMSRNTRSQVRRSDRAYEAWGPIAAARASTGDEALGWLDELLPLHASTWAARGTASAFTTAPVQRFMRALVAPGAADGTVDLLRITAGARVVGLLLNLQAGGRVAAYQSGFDYPGAPMHGKPGLTCHVAAMRRAVSAGMREYDFLAGDARYKDSLATGTRAMHWLAWQRAGSVAGVVAMGRRALGW